MGINPGTNPAYRGPVWVLFLFPVWILISYGLMSWVPWIISISVSILLLVGILWVIGNFAERNMH